MHSRAQLLPHKPDAPPSAPASITLPHSPPDRLPLQAVSRCIAFGLDAGAAAVGRGAHQEWVVHKQAQGLPGGMVEGDENAYFVACIAKVAREVPLLAEPYPASTDRVSLPSHTCPPTHLGEGEEGHEQGPHCDAQLGLWGNDAAVGGKGVGYIVPSGRLNGCKPTSLVCGRAESRA